MKTIPCLPTFPWPGYWSLRHGEHGRKAKLIWTSTIAAPLVDQLITVWQTAAIAASDRSDLQSGCLTGWPRIQW
jgi:hypothetical protein